MNKLILILLSITFACACNTSSVQFTEMQVSDFEIDNNALKHKEMVKVVYSSPMPDFNNDLEYYVLMKVVPVNTEDTVNILTISSALGIEEEDNERNFIHRNSNMYAVMESTMLNQDVKNYQPKEITRVLIDEEARKRVLNDHPYVIGIVGKAENGHIQVDMMDRMD